MINENYSTQIHQPRPAREIALYVHELEHQRSIEGSVPYEPRSGSLINNLKALRQNVSLLLTSFL